MICNCVHRESFSFGKLPPGLDCGDAAGRKPDYNRYSYAWNNPLKYIDPSGYNNIRLDENTTAIPYIAGSGGYLNNWNYITSGIGPGSGNHWSDQNRGQGGNFMLGNSRSFDGMYGQGAYDLAREVYKNHDARIQWVTGQGSLQKGMWLSEWRTNAFTQSGSMGSSITYSDGPEAINRFMKFSGTSGRVSNASGGRDRHITANDLWSFFMGGAGTLADVTSNGLHNSIYWVQKNGKVTMTKNIGNNYLYRRSNRIVGETLQNGKMVAKSLTQLNIAYSATDYALTWATTGMPEFGQGMDLFFTSVAAIPGAGWAVSGGYWLISSGSYAFTGKWMSEHMDSWVY